MTVEIPFYPSHVRFQTYFQFFRATLIKTIDCKKPHQLLESAIISHFKHIIKQWPSFYQISSYLGEIIISENNIELENGMENFYN